MKRKEKVKRMKSNASKTFTIIVIVLVSIALLGLVSSLFGGSSGSSGNFGGIIIKPEENLPPNIVITLDSNITLNQASHGEAYTENLEEKAYVFVKNGAKGDFINVDFPNVSIKEFWESNHTELKVSFDVLTFEGFSIPVMEIKPQFSSNAPEFKYSTTKLTPINAEMFACNTAYNTPHDCVIGSFNAPGVHKFEYVFSKDTENNLIHFKVCMDDKSNTFFYSITNTDFTLDSVKILLSNANEEFAVVRVENLEVGYVPLMQAYPGEVISLPTNMTVTEIGNYEAPLYTVGIDYSNQKITDGTKIEVMRGVDSRAYTQVYLANDKKAINVFDYDYLTVEYDVSVIESESPFTCAAYILGRPSGTIHEYYKSQLWIKADLLDNQIYGMNSSKTHITDSYDTIKVKYVIKVNHENNTADMQLFLNDILYMSDSKAFTLVNFCMNEIRIKAYSGVGSLGFENLLVKGYKIQ